VENLLTVWQTVSFSGRNLLNGS